MTLFLEHHLDHHCVTSELTEGILDASTCLEFKELPLHNSQMQYNRKGVDTAEIFCQDLIKTFS